ncbi:hypothetical protein JSO54_04685 [Riemerella anatipestifer]
MRNFANGYGFVYNIGGERVEGFTSLLWTLIGAIFFLILKAPEKLLLLVNITIISYTLYDVSNYIDRRKGSFTRRSLFFLAVIGVTPGFIDWTILSLMETGLWGFLLTLVSLKILRYKSTESKFKHYFTLCILYVLLLLCRPESMFLVPFFIMVSSIKEYFLSRLLKSVIIGTLINCFTFAITLFLLLFWRVKYFGYPLPNTYYAKVSNSRIDNLLSGIEYLSTLFFQKPFILVLLFFSIWFVFKSFSKNKAVLANTILVAIVGVSMLVPLFSGGDHFGLHRFIVPIIPLIVLLLVIVLRDLGFFTGKTKLILLFFLIFFSNEYNYKDCFTEVRYPLIQEWFLAIGGREESRKMNLFFKDNKVLPSQGVIPAGGFAFGYEGETIDLLGLNNTKMAHADKVKDRHLPKNHASFNLDIFFELSPDVLWYQDCKFVKPSELVPARFKIDSNEGYAKILKNIHLDKRFIENYGFFEIFHSKNKEYSLRIFANRKFVNSLDTSVYKVVPITYE